MPKVIAVTNQKGGVGKTTTCINLAAALVTYKQKVLMVDLDPQGNATMGSGVDKHDLQLSIVDVLMQQAQAAEVILQTDPAGFSLLPANADLTAAEVELINVEQKETRLKQAIDSVKAQFDYVLIDCPPSLNMLTINALTAADSVIIPIQCEYYALEGLSALMSTIEQIRHALNPSLHIEGLVRTMYDPRNSLTNDVSDQLQIHFGNRLYRTAIPRNVRLAEAPSHGMPAINYDKESRGAKAYLDLAVELLGIQTSVAQETKSELNKQSTVNQTTENEQQTEGNSVAIQTTAIIVE